MKNEQIKADIHTIFDRCEYILDLCLDHWPLTDKQIEGIVSQLVKLGESRNGQENEKFVRDIALAAINKIDVLYK